MSEDDLKAVLAKYQQKTFELYNTNIVLETQLEQLNMTIQSLSSELERLRNSKSRKLTKEDNGDF